MSFPPLLEFGDCQLRTWTLKVRKSTLKIAFIRKEQRPKEWSCLLWFQTGPKWRMREKGRGCAEEEVSAKYGEWERQVCCLLLHPSVLKVQVEPYSLRSACVCEEGGRKKGRAARKREWRDGRAWMEEGGRGGGVLLVISPEGDNGRGAHCNGCHVVPSLHN